MMLYVIGYANPGLFFLLAAQDEEWSDQEDDPHKDKEFEFLSEVIGPKGMAFDNDDVLDASDDDEDLKSDSISQMDMQVSCCGGV